MYKMKMMDHIVAHSLQVCRVATFLADSLEADLNPDLVQAAALLQHVLLDEYFASDSPTEADVVNYADKRVVHDKVATLAQRIDYIMERYGIEPKRREYIRMLWEKTKTLEEHLFRFCSFSPADMENLLGPDNCSADFSEYSRVNETVTVGTG
ncbi:MAG: hypothetical protein JRC53_06235, partial [Deltaproteobacteria bacterium]|nr:hypothetical protein [Deltaproteobacteria bacterium]